MRRSAFGVILLTILIIGALGAAGYGVYQLGFEQGLVETGAEVVVPGAAYYPGWLGFGLVGILFKILFLFLIIGLITRIFLSRRHWRGGPYWGKGWHDGEDGEGGAYRSPVEQRLSQWHERAHGEPSRGPNPDQTT